MGKQRPLRVYASTAVSPTQDIMPAAAWDKRRLSIPRGVRRPLVFDGHAAHNPWDEAYVAGSHGTLRSFGPNVNQQTVELSRDGGDYRPKLTGSWFPDGFHGAMGELLCAIEEKRQPSNDGRSNLRAWSSRSPRSASAMRHEPIVPGSIRKLPDPPSG